MPNAQHRVSDIIESLAMRAAVGLLIAACSWQAGHIESCAGWALVCQESSLHAVLSMVGWAFFGVFLLYVARAVQLWLRLRRWRQRAG